jgi:hypothetical protein
MKISLRRTTRRLFFACTCISFICGTNAFVPFQFMTPMTLQFAATRGVIVTCKKDQAGFHTTTTHWLVQYATVVSATTATSTCLHASPSSSQTTKSKSKQQKIAKKKKSISAATVETNTVVATVHRPVGLGRSLTQEELSNHVSGRYLEGKRQRVGSSSASPDATSDETREYVKQLDSRPSLVLNADYQVCAWM